VAGDGATNGKSASACRMIKEGKDRQSVALKKVEWGQKKHESDKLREAETTAGKTRGTLTGSGSGGGKKKSQGKNGTCEPRRDYPQ